PLRVAQHQAEDGDVGGVDDRHRQDANVGPLKAAEDVDQRPDAVGEEDVELAHARPVPAAGRGEIGSGAFSNAHPDPPRGQLTLTSPFTLSQSRRFRQTVWIVVEY